MRIADVIKKMIDFSQGNQHDISHFMKVYVYAKTIGESEGLDKETQETLEIAAIVHDIACPLCWEKYGCANGKDQEREGMPLTKEFLKNMDVSEKMAERVTYLVGHHHTLDKIEGLDYQILIEADYLVNAGEGNLSPENISHTLRTIFKTDTGMALLKSVYGVTG